MKSAILNVSVKATKEQQLHYYSTRQKVAKYLQSHPVQVILCVVVILDAGIVIAQILLDLHYFRGTSSGKSKIICIMHFLTKFIISPLAKFCYINSYTTGFLK